MTHTEILFLLPYIGSLLFPLSVFYYAFKRRNAKGVIAYLWYTLGQAIWIFGFIIELFTPTLGSKLFWDGIQWLANITSIVAFPVFAVQFTDHTIKNPRRLFTLSLIVPAIFAIGVMTDGLHHFVFSNAHLIHNQPFSELVYDFTWLVYGFSFYSYMTVIWGIRVLTKRFTQVHNLYRTQIAIIIAGFLIPIIGTFFSLIGIQFTLFRDAGPFTIAISNLIIAWGIFHFKLFETVPVGRDRLFEAMVDPVVILDTHHRVVDINSAMLALLNEDAQNVIGQPAKQIFDTFPIPIKLYTDASYARTETTFEIGGRDVYYELTVWPLYDSNKQMTGRIYISHDITALKELERELRDLNLDLEKRVRLRTKELAEAYDTTLEGWAKALELKDKETEGHSRRVTETTVTVARAMDIPEDDVEQIRRGALLHDIGKMGIPDDILRKNGTLTEEERQIVMKHPETAYELLKQIPFLTKALEIPHCHHERWDGTGYPQGLKGLEIPLSARIFAVVDVWDALTSDRPYRKAWEKDQVVQYLINESEKHFDPRVVNIFLDLAATGQL